jgi:O-antigen/teichoic acid export membrane protein
VPQALMQRAFQFKQRMILDPASKITFASMSILFALLGYGAWSMVIGSYASIITELVLSWWMAKWRPFRGRFSFRLWREMAAYSLPLMLQGMAESMRDAFQQIVVGRTLGTADLGQYRYGYRLAIMPAVANNEICGHVLFPAFSRIATDSRRFRDAFLRALGWTWFAALPTAALLVVVGEPAAVVLLGEEWRPAGIAAMAMAGMGVGAALNSLGVQAIKGAGRPSLVNWITPVGLVLHVSLILLLLPFGLVGVGIALSVTYLTVGVISVWIARSVAGASFRDTLGCVGPSTICAFLAFAVLFPAEHFVIKSERFIEPLGLASLVVDCLLFAAVYVGALRIVSPSRYRSLRGFAGRGVTRLAGVAHDLRSRRK